MNLDKRAVKMAIYGFLAVLFTAMFGLKPYLPRAFFYNYADIDDYKIFSNRVVKAAEVPQPWKVSDHKMAAPSSETKALLTELKTTALLVIENNQIVFEEYYPQKSAPAGKDEISASFSMAKTITGLLVGFAVQDHFIRSLDEPVSTYLTEWADVPQGKITIRQMLMMSSGLNWKEEYSNPFSITSEAYYGTNLPFTVLRQRPIEEPGKKFVYQSGTTQLLGLIVARATNKNLANYASEKLWIPLGAEKDALWSLDHENGVEKAYCCFNARAEDFARIGQLFLNEGKWTDASGTTRQLINKEYLTLMTTPNLLPDVDGKVTDYYGYHMWMLSTAHGNVPYARGILGQYIIVVPEKNRVVVRLGMKKGKSIEHHPVEVRALVDWAMQN